MTDWTQFHSLADIRKGLDTYLNTQYQNHRHSALKCSPKQRFIEEQERIRYMDNRELEECFLHTEYRKVRNDATISLQNEYYEVPQKYIGMRITIKYNPSEKEEIYIYEKGERKDQVQRLRRIDNASVKRNTIDFIGIGEEQ